MGGILAGCLLDDCNQFRGVTEGGTRARERAGSAAVLDEVHG